MKQINVGLIGFGMAGRLFHGPTISETRGLKLYKIRETKAPNIVVIRSKYPEAIIVDNTDEILNDPQIDLVVVATPNTTHHDVATQVLQAGKHVIVDKPFTVTTEEATNLIELAAAKSKLITVYQNRRWDSDFLTVKKIIDSNLLGNLVEYEAHYDRFRNTIRPDTWKEDGALGTGLLYDLGSHLIDQALILFGLPNSVFADLRTQRQQATIIDNFEMILDYGKLKVTLKGGMLIKEGLPHFTLLGNNGAFIKYGMDVQEEALLSGLTPSNTNTWGEEPETLWGTINTEVNGVEFRGKVKSEKGNYVAFYENVYRALIGEEELAVKAGQARNVIKVIELAMRSNQEKRTINFE